MELIIAGLAARPRELALATIMSWIPQDELERIAPTLSGDPEIISKLPKV